MTPSPRLQRRSKLQTGYRIAPDIERKMNEMIEEGEFVNRADIITTALRFWLDHRTFDVATAVRDYLQTDEGRELVREAAKKKK